MNKDIISHFPKKSKQIKLFFTFLTNFHAFLRNKTASKATLLTESKRYVNKKINRKIPIDNRKITCYNNKVVRNKTKRQKQNMRQCWNRQTGTFEGRVSLTYGFKSHLPHQTSLRKPLKIKGLRSSFFARKVFWDLFGTYF